MLISKALVTGALFFATFSIFAMFYSLFMTQLKFSDSSEYNFLSQDNSAWFQPKVKVVMFIIDALRFDYLLNYENIDYDPRLQDLKLNQFNKKYFEEPDKFVILRAISDTPTATVMRVPSLMTGNVPRKGSVLTAFGALPSIEDSIPRQLFNHGRKTGFAGDPILAEYFPNYMEVVNVEAFNLRDEDVDAPSKDFLNKKIQEGKFDCLLSHLLHIDHAGHLTTLYSQQMRHAMVDADTFLMHIMETIDDNTMLIFVGDHGMIKEGGHGGGTLQEINTAIVAYHKKGFMKNKQNNEQIKKVMKSINDTDVQNHQADIVPTLSMLMGVPVPFSSMGKILNDLYPAGDYLTEQNCPDSAFEMQMLHDNRLNSLQVWNYFKKYHEGQSLFSGKQYSVISNMAKELDDAYKATQKMITESKQCEASFHEVAINAILKSQEFSVTVYELVRDTPPYENAIFWQGFLMLVLVSVSYFLIIQYLFKTKDYEHISFMMPKNLKSTLKPFAYFAIIIALIWAIMLVCGSRIMGPITSSVFIIAIWLSGSAIMYFLPKRSGYSESVPSTPGIIEEREAAARIPSLGSIVRSQSLMTTGSGVAIILYLYYLVHIYKIDLFKFGGLVDYNRLMVVLLISARFCGKYPEKTKEIIMAAFVICPFIYMNSFGGLFSTSGFLKIGLFFIGDWIWGETQFMENKLKESRLWSQHYWLHFLVITMYHVGIGPSDDFIQIYLPRVVWALLIASCLAGFALRLPRQTIKRNIQINFVLYLVLMGRPRRTFFLYFVITLSIMRILKHQFKKSSFKNPLYPLLLAFVGFIGMFATGYMDGRLPLDFGPAFVGLREFHLVFDIIIYSIAMTSTIILGMLFISFLDQEVALEGEIKLGVPSEDNSDCEKMVAQEGYLNLIKKRNALYYCFFYSMIMIGAALNVMVFDKSGRFVLDKFLVDASLYSIVINSLYFML